MYMSLVFPFRFQEKGNLEVLLFTIQSRMRANNQRVYTPKEGVLVADINKVRTTFISFIRYLIDKSGKNLKKKNQYNCQLSM